MANDHAGPSRLHSPVEDARASDQRASVIAGVASIAATLSTAGAALLLDAGKLQDPPWIRLFFGGALVLSVGCFLMAAFFSLLVHGHRGTPDQEVPDAARGLRDAWQNANDKHHYAILALGMLVGGLFFVLIITVLAMWATPSS